jgi:hypothetical protein
MPYGLSVKNNLIMQTGGRYMQQQIPRKIRRKKIPARNMEAESEFDQIIAHLSEYGTAQIGHSYFFIRSQGNYAALFRTNLGYGRIYSSEVVDHHQYGISDDDIDHALRIAPPPSEIRGYYPVSRHIEKKLRVLFD